MADSCIVRMVEDRAAWDFLVAGAAGGTVFSTSAWMEALARAERGVFAPYGFYRNGNLVAGCAVLLRQRACTAMASIPYSLQWFHRGDLRVGQRGGPSV